MYSGKVVLEESDERFVNILVQCGFEVQSHRNRYHLILTKHNKDAQYRPQATFLNEDQRTKLGSIVHNKVVKGGDVERLAFLLNIDQSCRRPAKEESPLFLIK